MAINSDAFAKRIDLAQTPDLPAAIRDECAIQAAHDNARRLVSAFESQNQLILIFELATQ